MLEKFLMFALIVVIVLAIKDGMSLHHLTQTAIY